MSHELGIMDYSFSTMKPVFLSIFLYPCSFHFFVLGGLTPLLLQFGSWSIFFLTYTSHWLSLASLILIFLAFIYIVFPNLYAYSKASSEPHINILNCLLEISTTKYFWHLRSSFSGWIYYLASYINFSWVLIIVSSYLIVCFVTHLRNLEYFLNQQDWLFTCVCVCVSFKFSLSTNNFYCYTFRISTLAMLFQLSALWDLCFQFCSLQIHLPWLWTSFKTHPKPALLLLWTLQELLTVFHE